MVQLPFARCTSPPAIAVVAAKASGAIGNWSSFETL